jgi:multisubunit Na+/H+ antiporter MnhB subunit
LKVFNYILLALFAGLMLYATAFLPPRGDPHAPMHEEQSILGTPLAGAYFIQNAYVDAATPNMVTVVLADYRSFDTFGEVVVVFTAAIACYLILRRREERKKG